jgi:hypothetical protein
MSLSLCVRERGREKSGPVSCPFVEWRAPKPQTPKQRVMLFVCTLCVGTTTFNVLDHGSWVSNNNSYVDWTLSW